MTFSHSFLVHKPTAWQKIASRMNPKRFGISQNSLFNSLPEHLHKPAEEIQPWLCKHNMLSENIAMYYPGCGQDLVWPMLILDGVAHAAKKWTVIGQDINNCLDALISTCQSLTGQNVFSDLFDRKSSEMRRARFRFKDKTVEILFFHSDALESLPIPVKDGYDIYLERGFELIRSQRPGFIDEALRPLRPEGLAITDAGFPKGTKGIKAIPLKMPEWGFYKTAKLYINERESPF